MKKIICLCLAAMLTCQVLNITPTSSIAKANNSADVVHITYTDFSQANNFQKSYKRQEDQRLKTDMIWDQDNIITVLPQDRQQKMIGVGGALTESAVSVINKLSETKKQALYDAYFSKEGSSYSLIRTHIGSCDFSTHEYTYAPDKEASINTNLANFSIQDDKEDIIPAIKRGLSYNPDIKVFAAPWAPPAWMKVSGKRYGDGAINLGSISTTPNHLDPRYYDLYARYLIKFIEAYKEEGIDLYSLSLQNEAQNNPDWEACYWSTDQATNFIADYLGPQLHRANLQDVKLLIWDWDKQEGAIGKGDGFLTFNRTLLNSRAKQYIDGVAFHWYGPVNLADEINKRPTWAINAFANIQTLKDEYPNTHFIATEGCQEKGPWLGSVEPAKRYAFDIIGDIQYGTEGWIDWNMVLNNQGGPLHNVQNYCHAPIMVDTQSGDITYNPAYFVLKHFSRTIRPGDHKIKSYSSIDTYKDGRGLQQVAFIDRETGNVKVIVANITDYNQTFLLREGGRGMKASLAPLTMATYEFKRGEDTRYNVSLNQSSKASSFENNPVNDYRSYSAFDGETTTRWASDWNKDQEWLQVDLGQHKAISGVDLDWEWGWKNRYQIQVSDDGVHWITAKFIDGSQHVTNTTQKHYPMTLFFEPIKGRYVRLQGEKNIQGYGYSLYGFQVWASGPNNGDELKNTAAIGKPATASSYEKNLLYNYNAQSAFDGKDNTRWASDWYKDKEWIQVDLIDTKRVAGVELNWEWGWKNQYQIQTSKDGLTWTTMVEMDGSPNSSGITWNNPSGNRQIIRINFEPTQTRFVRMQGIKNKQGYGYSLYQLKVLTLE